MATRSVIFKETTEGIVVGKYIHWDGYPSYVGRILNDSYNTDNKVNLLFSHPNYISSLGETIDETRWGDEEMGWSSPIRILDVFEAAAKSWVEWIYLYKDGQWYGTNLYLKNPHVLRTVPQLINMGEDEWDNDAISGQIEDLKQGLNETER
jgi:hypothetical protein